MPRMINSAGRKLIRGDEACRLTAYRDQGKNRGVWTIGWGHTGPEVVEGLTWTQEQADAAFEKDIAVFEWQVDRHTYDVATGGNQFAAMVALAYNIGAGAFLTTSVLVYHRLGQYPRAADAFLLWDKEHVDGVLVEVAGLKKRRGDERALYLTPDAPAQEAA